VLNIWLILVPHESTSFGGMNTAKRHHIKDGVKTIKKRHRLQELWRNASR